MKTITAKQITEAVAELCIKANKELPEDVELAIKEAQKKEEWQLAKDTIGFLYENLHCAKEGDLPICQDTGMACVFVKLGNEVYIEGNLEKAINEGVAKGYEKGLLRKSVVGDPLRRVNTENNTPAIVSTEIVEGDGFEITVAPKGFGSENMSRVGMLKPSDGIEGFCDFVVETVRIAGPNPCPPIILGVGVGGTFDKVAYLSKKALLRPLNVKNDAEFYADLEKKILDRINERGIGPQGFGGKTTCLGVAIEKMATHVAGLPVAVNVSCHVTRRASVKL